ncbi:hypothetical protein HNQ59_004005, partial [Chitinivorax tropicus]|nr:hypothetical protein [Chitinivorax tropicus]
RFHSAIGTLALNDRQFCSKAPLARFKAVLMLMPCAT